MLKYEWEGLHCKTVSRQSTFQDCTHWAMMVILEDASFAYTAMMGPLFGR